MPKVEPIDSPLTDYSGDNTNDTDIAILDDSLEKKYSISSPKSQHFNDSNGRKWINEVSSTQPCLNTCDNDDKEIEIDKEVETVLQSGTIVESLNIATENLNLLSNEAVKGIVYSVSNFYNISNIEYF